jgi:hypothetical protein
MPSDYFAAIVQTSKCKGVCDVFSYCARRMPERGQDYILVQFYKCLGFMIRFKSREAEPAHVFSKAAADGVL